MPPEIQQKIAAVVNKDASSLDAFTALYQHLAKPPAKKRKTPEVKREQLPSIPPAPEVKVENGIQDHEIIFELPLILFQLPIRKKLSLIFHLIIQPDNTPEPALSIANSATRVPEISLKNLQQSIKLCVLLPILGNSTITAKKNTGALCFWLHDLAVTGKNEPIICQVNFDLIKKQLIKAGKIPADAESQLEEGLDDGIKPINEAIIDFLQRQFKLCHINLINYLPSSNPAKNKLTINTDNGIAVSMQANNENDLVIVAAYKGSRDGLLLLLSNNNVNPPYVIFGFRKPIILIERSKIKSISYHNITRLTFSVIVTVENEAKPNGEEAIEFSMIDQKYYLIIDDFIATQEINNNSFDDQYREAKKETETAVEAPAAEGDSDNEDEDGTYTGAVEEDHGDSGDSDVAEEFDSAADSGSGSDEDLSGDNLSGAESEGED